MTTTEPTTEETDERIVVIPEVTISANHEVTKARVLEKYEHVKEQLDELHAEALVIRDAYEQALGALGQYMDMSDDSVHELAGQATGWIEVWETLIHIGDLFSDQEGFGIQGKSNIAILRGEPSYPQGTIANVVDEDGGPMRVEVEFPETDSRDHYLVVNLAEPTHKRYTCSHEEIGDGLVSVPGPDDDKVAIARRHVEWRRAAVANAEAEKGANN